MITEDLIGKLIGYNGGGIRCIDMAERCSDVAVIARQIFTLGLPSSKIRDLKDKHKIWAKIILGCFNHRKPTSSPDYINIDQQFLIYFISQKVADCRAHSVWSGDCRYRLVADGDRITGSGRDQTAGAGV